MTIEALLFDVDGTLADTEEAHRTAFNLAFERHRLDWSWSPDDYRRLLAVTGGKERMAAHIDTLGASPAEKKRLRELVPELHAAKTAIYTDIVGSGGITLRTGVARLLEEAQAAGLRLAIASTTTAANVDALLEATLGPSGLNLFDVIACGDAVRAKKPAPDIYQLALRTLGVPAERAVAIEDSLNGLRSAQAAGLWTLVTTTFWTEGDDFSAADLVLPHLGSADEPLPGEPGLQLRRNAWLAIDELLELAAPQRVASSVQSLYMGAA